MIGNTDRMQRSKKIRVSLTLSRDLLDQIDGNVARTPKASRSAIVEAWLRRAARERAEADLEQAIANYYDGLTSAEKVEQSEWARFSTSSFQTRERRAAWQGRRQGRRPRRRGK